MPSSAEASSLIQALSGSPFMIPSQQTHSRFATGGSMRKRSVRYFCLYEYAYEELLGKIGVRSLIPPVGKFR